MRLLAITGICLAGFFLPMAFSRYFNTSEAFYLMNASISLLIATLVLRIEKSALTRCICLLEVIAIMINFCAAVYFLYMFAPFALICRLYEPLLIILTIIEGLLLLGRAIYDRFTRSDNIPGRQFWANLPNFFGITHRRLQTYKSVDYSP